ncbi:MAG: hypothetical protein K0U37_01465 [Gammaproteobacteria bacterium]|nr:hypothetical protein [Gammaproteobacteria bacterium]
MLNKSEKDNQGLYDNNTIYRLVGKLIQGRADIDARFSTTDLSEADLKFALKQELEKNALRKDIKALGGLESSAIDGLLDGFVKSLPKPALATPVTATPSVVHAANVSAEPVRRYRYETIDVDCSRCRRSCCSCSHSSDSFWFWMYLFNRGGGGTTNNYYSGSNDSKKEDNGLFVIVAFIAVVMMLASAVIASIYLFGEIADIIERLRHNEGRSYAMLSLGLLGISAAGSFLGATALVPLILVAAGASNLVGWSIFGVTCLGLLFTSVSHALLFGFSDLISGENFKETFGSNSFVAKDFGRVQLTKAEEKHLCDKEDLDPMKVRIAIALLRREMGAGAVPNKYGNHALFSQACRTEKQQKHLDTIRVLRSGDLEGQEFENGIIKVGNMTVDMRMKSTANVQVAQNVSSSAPSSSSVSDLDAFYRDAPLSETVTQAYTL